MFIFLQRRFSMEKDKERRDLYLKEVVYFNRD